MVRGRLKQPKAGKRGVSSSTLKTGAGSNKKPALPQEQPAQSKPVQAIDPSNKSSNPRPLNSKPGATFQLFPAIGSVSELVPAMNPTLRQTLFRLKKQPWRWQLVWLSALCLFGGMGASAYLWLAGLPPLPNCAAVTPVLPETQRLYCAREIARSGKLADLVAGMVLLEQWSPEHPLYKDARQSIDDWSALVLLIARDKMDQSDLKGAVEAASKIPRSSPVAKEAQKAIAEWQQQWQQGETLYAKAEAAVKDQDWKLATEQVSEMGYLDHDYWRIQQADVLAKQILTEKQARQTLNQAQKLAKGRTDQLGEAVALAQQVAPKTNAWGEAKIALQEWSQTLLNLGMKQWQEGDMAGAIATVQQIPSDVSLPLDARELVQFSHAQKLADESTQPGELNWGQLWNLAEAMAAASQITPQSPLYAQAQTDQQNWQTQMQDLLQLQVANLVASLGQRPNLEFAIDQAKQIAPDHSQRAQAQTLVAHWQKTLEQLEDRPYLARAQKLAASGKLADLQVAIAQAKEIPSDHVLGQEAQDWIERWNHQLQTAEDQPIWEEAQTLAKQGKLDEAIAAAQRIRPERSLYLQAQAAIDSWKTALRNAQIAKDQPLLDQAIALAAKEHLTEAIEMASRIEPGRALYLDAQASIAEWLKERDGISNAQTSSSPDPDSSPSPAPDPDASQPPAADASASDPNPSDSSPPDSSPSDAALSQPSDAPAEVSSVGDENKPAPETPN